MQPAHPAPLQKGFSSLTLKLIAIAAMTIDHIAWETVPLESPLGQLLHLIGRITVPIMAFMIAEGYRHTRNLRRYAGRLALFALLSHFPYVYYKTGTFTLFFFNTSVIFTLLLGLLVLILLQDNRIPTPLAILGTIVLLLLAQFGNWSHYAVVWVVIFGQFSGQPKQAMVRSAGVTVLYFLAGLLSLGSLVRWYECLYMLGGLLAIPLLSRYNGQRGRLRLKYLFYIYYPLHLILLRLLFPLS